MVKKQTQLHFLTSGDFDDLITDLNLLKKEAELLVPVCNNEVCLEKLALQINEAGIRLLRLLPNKLDIVILTI